MVKHDTRGKRHSRLIDENTPSCVCCYFAISDRLRALMQNARHGVRANTFIFPGKTPVCNAEMRVSLGLEFSGCGVCYILDLVVGGFSLEPLLTPIHHRLFISDDKMGRNKSNFNSVKVQSGAVPPYHVNLHAGDSCQRSETAVKKVQARPFQGRTSLSL